jgi:hypothetical protein
MPPAHGLLGQWRAKTRDLVVVNCLLVLLMMASHVNGPILTGSGWLFRGLEGVVITGYECSGAIPCSWPEYLNKRQQNNMPRKAILGTAAASIHEPTV